MSDKIDIVILWVDGNDEKWLNKKNLWQEKYGIISKSEERYRDWDNLQYLFRGIEKYASWVNHVYLVTDDQKPEWLDEDYSKVTVVDHTEIIDEEFLPTFNTNAIELNIHNIEQLSENFLYFNDDMFIIDKVLKEDFFENGIPKEVAYLDINIPFKDQPISNFIFNDLTLINDSFDKHEVINAEPCKWLNIDDDYDKKAINNHLLLTWKYFTGFVDPHLCIPFQKKTFDTIWEKYNKELLKTTKSKFREDHNYNVWLMRYWQLASNNFVNRKHSLGKLFGIRGQDTLEKSSSYIKEQKGKMICVNDNEYLTDFDGAKEIINNEFLSLFPEKSKFEK